MPATLNQDDIKLLKSVFVTKFDLVAMEKRQEKKYATKNDLTSVRRDLVAMEKRQDAKYAAKDDLRKLETSLEKKIKDAIEESENSIIQAVTGVEIELRGKIKRLEDVVGISAAN
ncbi:MAG: hypothetical protein AAB887_02385 [Patescibacteria group bacterium]